MFVQNSKSGITSTAPICKPSCTLDNLVVLETPCFDPDWSAEGGRPLVTILIRLVKVVKLPVGNTQAQATLHLGDDGILSVIPATEAGAYSTSVSRNHGVISYINIPWME